MKRLILLGATVLTACASKPTDQHIPTSTTQENTQPSPNTLKLTPEATERFSCAPPNPISVNGKPFPVEWYPPRSKITLTPDSFSDNPELTVPIADIEFDGKIYTVAVRRTGLVTLAPADTDPSTIHSTTDSRDPNLIILTISGVPFAFYTCDKNNDGFSSPNEVFVGSISGNLEPIPSTPNLQG